MPPRARLVRPLPRDADREGRHSVATATMQVLATSPATSSCSPSIAVPGGVEYRRHAAHSASEEGVAPGGSIDFACPSSTTTAHRCTAADAGAARRRRRARDDGRGAVAGRGGGRPRRRGRSRRRPPPAKPGAAASGVGVDRPVAEGPEGGSVGSPRRPRPRRRRARRHRPPRRHASGTAHGSRSAPAPISTPRPAPFLAAADALDPAPRGRRRKTGPAADVSSGPSRGPATSRLERELVAARRRRGVRGVCRRRRRARGPLRCACVLMNYTSSTQGVLGRRGAAVVPRHVVHLDCLKDLPSYAR